MQKGCLSRTLWAGAGGRGVAPWVFRICRFALKSSHALLPFGVGANLRASPPAAGPSGHQLTGDWQDWQDWQDLQDWQDWQSAVKGDFGHPNLYFWGPGGSILVPWDILFVIWCPLDHPMDYLGVQIWILIDF